MQCVLDSNEFIFGLGEYRKPSCETFLELIINKADTHPIRICNTIVEEVKRNLTPEKFKEFLEIITAITKIDPDILIPFELGLKYEMKGLKSADSFIAAFTDWSGSDLLVTENRHFLSRRPDLPFKVVTAEAAIFLIHK